MSKQRLFPILALGLAFLLLFTTTFVPQSAVKAAGVVGDGTPGSCTEAAFDTALIGGGTITFNCGAAPHTIILTNIKIIKNDTEIQGDHKITLSGGNTTALFSVSATLTLREVTLTRGFGSYGTIRNFETVNLINSKITYGNATSIGGAIDNYGTVNLTNSTLAYNNANNAGGALHNDWGEVAIENSQIYSNTTSNEGGGIKNNIGAMTIQNSQIFDNQATGCGPGSGGGIWNSGILTVTQSTIATNKATNGGGIYNTGIVVLDLNTIENNSLYGACYGSGGGIYNTSQVSATKTEFNGNHNASYGGGIFTASNSLTNIKDSTFKNNTALGGAGISNSGTLTLTNSTIYTNTANYGGGIANGIAGGSPNILNLTNVTISDNSSLGSGGGLQTDNGTTTVIFSTLVGNRGESGVEQFGGQLIFSNSIVSDNSPKNCEGSITSQGFNISSDYSCSLYQGGDKVYTNPLLGPLSNNGGPTLTHLPQENSPAFDGGQCVVGVDTDQRGVSRPQEAACDIGAVEIEILPPMLYIYLPIILEE